MKSKPLVLLLVLFLTLAFSACKRCLTCTYTVVTSGVSSSYEESNCGSKQEMEQYETDFAAQADSLGATYSCVKQ